MPGKKYRDANKTCKSCGDFISGSFVCERCEKEIEDECETCHSEKVHGAVEISNVNIAGNQSKFGYKKHS